MAAVARLREHHAALSAADTRLQALAGVIRGIGPASAAVTDVCALTKTDLLEAAAADMRLVSLEHLTPEPNGYVARFRRIEELRDAAVKLKHFTASEYAAVLRCTTARATQELIRLDREHPGMVVKDGYCRGARMYRYVPPTAPGAAFDAQQRELKQQRENGGGGAGPRVGDMARAAGGTGIQQSMLRSIRDKEVRKVAREALDNGWELVQRSGAHPMRLVRRGRDPVPLHTSPRNSGNAAKVLRDELK